MKQIIILLFMLIAGFSFAQPAKTDPYFVKSTDTVSVRGPMCITRYIQEDRQGNIWLATWQGIMKYDGKVFTNYTLKESLIPFHVYSIYEDKSGNIWFGTVRGGAYKYNGSSFTLFTSENGLPDDLIGCVMEDRNGNIWFGTDAGVGVMDTSSSHRTSPKTNFVTLSGLPLTSKKGVTSYSTHNGLTGNSVNSIIQDRSGKIWIGTRSGVSCFDGKTFSNFNVKPGVPFTNVRCIREDRNGKIWIGGQEGLYCYDPAAPAENALVQHVPNFIGYIYEDRAGNLWVNAGETKGMTLNKYDGKKLTNVVFKNAERDFQVFEMTEDRKGNIWFGTMQGPCCYDGKTFNYFRN